MQKDVKVALATGVFGGATLVASAALVAWSVTYDGSPEPAPPAAKPSESSQPSPSTSTESSIDQLPPTPDMDFPAMDFTGASATDGDATFTVEKVYVDDDGIITDGMGSEYAASPGMEFAVANVTVFADQGRPVNWEESSEFVVRGFMDTSGQFWQSDAQAEWFATGEYDHLAGTPIDAGRSVSVDVISQVPKGTEFSDLTLMMSEESAMVGFADPSEWAVN